jgi:hypothetical protein
MAAPTDQQILDAFKTALLALATAQSYTMPGGRSLTRASIPDINKTIALYEQRIAMAQNPSDGLGIILISTT